MSWWRVVVGVMVEGCSRCHGCVQYVWLPAPMCLLTRMHRKEHLPWCVRVTTTLVRWWLPGRCGYDVGVGVADDDICIHLVIYVGGGVPFLWASRVLSM